MSGVDLGGNAIRKGALKVAMIEAGGMRLP